MISRNQLGFNLIQICPPVAQLLSSLFTLCNQGNHRNHLKIFAICHFLSSCLWLMLVFLVIWLDWQVIFNLKISRSRSTETCIGFVLMTPAIILSLLEILKKTNLTAIIIQHWWFKYFFKGQKRGKFVLKNFRQRPDFSVSVNYDDWLIDLQ